MNTQDIKCPNTSSHPLMKTKREPKSIKRQQSSWEMGVFFFFFNPLVTFLHLPAERRRSAGRGRPSPRPAARWPRCVRRPAPPPEECCPPASRSRARWGPAAARRWMTAGRSRSKPWGDDEVKRMNGGENWRKRGREVREYSLKWYNNYIDMSSIITIILFISIL